MCLYTANNRALELVGRRESCECALETRAYRVGHFYEVHRKPAIAVVQHLDIERDPTLHRQLDLKREPVSNRLLLVRFDQAAAHTEVEDPQRYRKKVAAPAIEWTREARMAASADGRRCGVGHDLLIGPKPAAHHCWLVAL